MFVAGVLKGPGDEVGAGADGNGNHDDDDDKIWLALAEAVMGLYEARGNLTKGMKELMQRWLDTKALWRDAAAQQFEEKYIASMERDFRSAVSAMDHAGKIVAQIRNECGEQRD